MADTDRRWVGLAEAAKLAGVSVKTLRRRLAAGTLEGQRVEHNGQQVWQVPADALDSRTDTDNVDRTAGLGRDTASPELVRELVQLLAAQQQTIAALTEQLGQATGQLAQLSGGRPGVLQRLLGRGHRDSGS